MPNKTLIRVTRLAMAMSQLNAARSESAMHPQDGCAPPAVRSKFMWVVRVGWVARIDPSHPSVSATSILTIKRFGFHRE